jgi:hypothetical protein
MGSTAGCSKINLIKIFLNRKRVMDGWLAVPELPSFSDFIDPNSLTLHSDYDKFKPGKCPLQINHPIGSFPVIRSNNQRKV